MAASLGAAAWSEGLVTDGDATLDHHGVDPRCAVARLRRPPWGPPLARTVHERQTVVKEPPCPPAHCPLQRAGCCQHCQCPHSGRYQRREVRSRSGAYVRRRHSNGAARLCQFCVWAQRHTAPATEPVDGVDGRHAGRTGSVHGGSIGRDSHGVRWAPEDRVERARWRSLTTSRRAGWPPPPPR